MRHRITASGAQVVGAGYDALGVWPWPGERGDLGALDAPKTFRQEIGCDIVPILLQRSDGRVLAECFKRRSNCPLR